MDLMLAAFGSFWIPALAAAAIAYFCGCFNGAVIVSKYILRDDVRNHGSGNAGLTNFYRTFGGPLTFVVILTDVLKAVVAVLVSVALFRICILEEFPVLVLARYWGGLFCLLGHMFPCMFGFKGGKGILSGGTVALMIDWRVALVVWGGFLVLAVLTKYVSLGSVLSAGSFGFIYAWVHPDAGVFPIAVALFLSAMVVWMHRANIVRLVKGQERKTNLLKKGKQS